MNESQKAKWEQTRAKRFWRFVLLYCFFLAGGMIIATSIFDYFFSSRGLRLEDIILKVLIFLVVGFVGGVATWFVGEYRYKKSSASST
jgi:Na+/melibiose symporter-like transporter